MLVRWIGITRSIYACRNIINAFRPTQNIQLSLTAHPITITKQTLLFSTVIPRNKAHLPLKKRNKRPKKKAKWLKKLRETYKDPLPNISIDDYVKTIDTTLTPEQKEHIAMLKKKISGGHRSPRSFYREVPKPGEVQSNELLVPNVPENAQELVDYALSFVPKRDGPRKHKKRMRQFARAEFKRWNDMKRKLQTRMAKKVKIIKKQKKRELTNEIKAKAEELRIAREEKLNEIRERLMKESSAVN